MSVDTKAIRERAAPLKDFAPGHHKDVNRLLDALEAAGERERRMKEAVGDLLESLHPYYWHEDDEELARVNRLRTMLGMRAQMPKCCEAEVQADEAEGKAVAHEDYHAGLYDPTRDTGEKL